MGRKTSLPGGRNISENTAGQEPAGRAATAGTLPTPEKPCLIVGIGASAGGQEALEEIFTAVPPDCGLSFVVIMHIPPSGPSFLAEMLGRYTPMPVVTAEEGMALLPNRIQVIPAGREIIVRNQVLSLEEPELRGVRHPIDRLLNSLAAEAGARAVAVILSGSGSDGAKGVKAVSAAGGTVIIQEPESAMYPDMPENALASGAVDFALPAAGIACKIAEIAGRSCSINPPACRVKTLDDELAAIFRIVKGRTGHDFGSYKTNTVVRRIERRMAVNDVSGMRKYVGLLEESPQEAHALAQDILIGVTGFFRDPEAFATIEQVVIPGLFAGRSLDDPVRIWHACCATGEEVYSMAFLIREYLDRHGSKVKVQIFATDIDETSIAQARAGLYPEGIEEAVGEQRLKAFFTQNGRRWQVVKPVREMIVFAHHSLIKNPPFSRLDLLVCRNFLIYLNPDMQKRLIALFHQVLRPGRFLFLGSSETVGRNVDLFSAVDKKWKIFERLESKRRSEPLFPFSTPVRYLPGAARSPKLAEAVEMSHVAVAERLLMERYSPPCVIVTEKYEVVHVTSRLNRFLEVPVGEPSRDILRMAREELRPALRAAIHKAFAENRRVEFRGLRTVVDGVETAANLLVEPLEVGHGSGRLAMVIFEPVFAPAPVTALTGGEEHVCGGDATGEMLVRQLEEQLRITHEQLQATTEQLESSNEGFLSANEELISMNEEFQSANEELQSTNEELETSKEELQALNEELVTVNAELEEKIEELNQSSSDMENLLASSEIAIIFLDRKLFIKRFSPAMADIFNLIPADIGRPFRHLAGTIDWSGLPDDAAAVLEKSVAIEREVSAVGDGRCFLMRVLPYRASEGGIDGVVVTLTDISHRKQLEEQTVHLASFPQLNPNPVLEVDAGGRIIFANPATHKILASLGMDANADIFLPADLGGILRDWDRQNDATLNREIVIADRAFGESIFLSPKFEMARIYAYDITERKRAQEALAESEERVRRKLESIISPKGDIGNLELADIIDAPVLQALMDDFYALTRMPMGLIDLKGEVLVGVGWQDICTKFHRINPESCRNCVESDTLLSVGVTPGQYRVYKCKNHLWDVATPVMVGDRQFGNLFMGQFFFEDEPIDYGLFRAQARRYGFDEQEYIAALDAVPRLSRETLNTGMAFFMKLADILSRQSYSNLKLARSLEERNALMESLYESGEQLRLAHQAARIGSFNWNVQTGENHWTPELEAMYGLNAGEFGRTQPAWENLVHPDDRADAISFVNKAFESGEPVEGEWRVIWPDGSVHWLFGRFQVFRDEAGNPLRLAGVNIDVTARKQAEDVLRRYELLAGHSRDIILFIRREDGRILEANAAAANAYGYDHRELLGLSVRDLRAPEALALTADQLAAADSQGILFETVHRRKDGSTFPVEVSSQGATIGGTRTLISVIRDITERKQAEEALRRTHDQLELRVKERTGELAVAVESLLAEMAERERTEGRLQRLNRIYAVLSETDQAIVRAIDKESLFRDFCRIAVEQGGFILSWLGLVDEESGRVNVVAASGATGYLERIRITAREEPEGGGPTGITIREGTYFICNDFQNDPCTRPWHEQGLAYGICASASVALKEEGRVIGTLNLYAGVKDFFDQQHIDLLRQMGADISFALDNFKRENHRRKTEQALREETLERLRAVEALREKEQLLLQQSRLAAMGEMINNIAHQWRQPLNVLGMNIQRTMLYYELGDFDGEFLKTSTDDAMKLIRHMSQTIDDFRNFFKADKEKTCFSVSQAIQWTLSLIRDGLDSDHIELTAQNAGDPHINGYFNEFCQVLLNIVQNARDAIVERKIAGGAVTIVSAVENGRTIITIGDNAGGIPEEIIDRIFEPYFSTKGVQGTGIGLFMSKNIIETNMAGSITVRNTDLGAEFRIEI